MLDISVLILVTAALGTIIKKLGTPKKLIPLSNLIFGIGLGVVFLSDDWKTNLFTGIIIGLSASGLFDHTKITKNK